MKRILTILALLASAAFGADVTGNWTFEVESSAGSGSPKFALKQSGEKISGKYSGQLGEAEVMGSVKGKAVLIEFEVQGAKVIYEGTLDESGNTIKGKVDLAGQATGTFTGKKS